MVPCVVVSDGGEPSVHEVVAVSGGDDGWYPHSVVAVVDAHGGQHLCLCFSEVATPATPTSTARLQPELPSCSHEHSFPQVRLYSLTSGQSSLLLPLPEPPQVAWTTTAPKSMLHRMDDSCMMGVVRLLGSCCAGLGTRLWLNDGLQLCAQRSSDEMRQLVRR